MLAGSPCDQKRGSRKSPPTGECPNQKNAENRNDGAI